MKEHKKYPSGSSNISHPHTQDSSCTSLSCVSPSLETSELHTLSFLTGMQALYEDGDSVTSLLLHPRVSASLHLSHGTHCV